MPTLNWPFSSQDVLDQFAPSEAMPHNVEQMHNEIFNPPDAWGSGDELRDFDGTGQPRIDTLTPQQISCSGGTVTVRLRAEITDMGGLDCNYRFEWDTDPLFGSSSFTTAGSEPASSGDGTIVTTDITTAVGNTVYVKSQVWNAYNDAATSDYYTDPTDESLATSKGTLATPSIITAEYDFPDLYIEFSSDSDMGSGTSAIQTQYRWDTGGDGNYNSWQATDGAECVKDLGTASAEAVINTSGGWNPGTDDVQIRVRLASTPCDNNSNYSSEASCSAGIFSCPL